METTQQLRKKQISDGYDNLDGSQGLFNKSFNVSVGLHTTMKRKLCEGKQTQSCQGFGCWGKRG